MEEQNKDTVIAEYKEKDLDASNKNPLQAGSFKSHYWKFIGGFFALLLIGVIGIPVVGQYMQKQEAKMRAEQVENNERIMNELVERLKNDKNGGATPEETLRMFIAALKKGDIEQANKYFVIEPKERQEMLIGLLKKLQEAGEMEKFVEYLRKVGHEKNDDFSDGSAWFSYLTDQGKIGVSIEITKGKYSTVWKIENLMF